MKSTMTNTWLEGTHHLWKAFAHASLWHESKYYSSELFCGFVFSCADVHKLEASGPCFSGSMHTMSAAFQCVLGIGLNPGTPMWSLLCGGETEVSMWRCHFRCYDSTTFCFPQVLLVSNVISLLRHESHTCGNRLSYLCNQPGSAGIQLFHTRR